MITEKFYNAIKKSITPTIEPTYFILIQEFLRQFDLIINKKTSDTALQMTKATILFEGFYQISLPFDSVLKEKLLILRKQRWLNHFGTPTISFLLTYSTPIKQTTDFFQNFQESKVFSNPIKVPWNIIKTKEKMDFQNNILIKENAITKIASPESKEKAGEFVKTHNPSGGFTMSPCDPFSLQFIEYSSTLSKKNGRVLEIGAGFGAASLEALARGATVFCNDIDPKNLAVVCQRYLQETKKTTPALTGDDSKLIFIPGSFPEELSALPQEHFDAILICRVLHFFSGEKIEKSLLLLSKLLKPGAKLFVICETPFLKNWQPFIIEHEKRVRAGFEWPGEISNPHAFESSGRSATLPGFVHWITKEILDRSLIRAHLQIEHSGYINRKRQFPPDLLFDGRESVGAVSVKPLRARL